MRERMAKKMARKNRREAFIETLRNIVSEAFPPEINCDSGFSYDDVIDYYAESEQLPSISERPVWPRKRKQFAVHLNGCLVCAVRLGEMRVGARELQEAYRSVTSSSEVKITEKARVVAQKMRILEQFLNRNWGRLQKKYPGKTILIWFERNRVRVREYCAGRRSPAKIVEETENSGLPKARFPIYIPQSGEPQLF